MGLMPPSQTTILPNRCAAPARRCSSGNAAPRAGASSLRGFPFRCLMGPLRRAHLHALHCFMHWKEIRFANRTKPCSENPSGRCPNPRRYVSEAVAPGGLGYVVIGKASVEPTLLRRCGWRGRSVGGSDRGWVIGNDAIGLLRFFPRFLPNVVDLLLAVRATP